MDKFDEILVEMYGTQVIDDLPELRKRISAVVGAFLYFGNKGDNLMNDINRLMEEVK